MAVCKIEPDFGLNPVLRHAVAFIEQKAEQELSRRLALFSSLMKPARGEDIVLGNAQTILIHIAEIGLGDRRAPLGFDHEKRRGANIIMAREGALAGAEAVRFRAGCEAQSHQRHSESNPAAGADEPTAVWLTSICRHRPPVPSPKAGWPQTRRLGRRRQREP